jgi:integrase
MLRHICRRIGLPALRFHDLRHTYATLALESGVSPREVAGWLGHSSVQTTLQIYWGSLNTNTDVNSFLPGGNHE